MGGTGKGRAGSRDAAAQILGRQGFSDPRNHPRRDEGEGNSRTQRRGETESLWEMKRKDKTASRFFGLSTWAGDVPRLCQLWGTGS